MLSNYVEAKCRTITEYTLCFDDGRYNGFGFPCDEKGNLLEGLTEAAISNYKRCLENPDKFERFNKVVKTERRVRDDAHGTCECGTEVYLYNQYMGACECPNCGKWYNLFGQELNNPMYWEEGNDW